MKKKIIFSIFIIIVIGGILYCAIICYKNANQINTETDIPGKEITKEEYIYKEELLNLGYSIDEINTIENKISTTNVKTYLLETKYKDLLSFIDSPYYKIENTSRYQTYLDNHDYTPDNVIVYVEIGLDKEFYTNIQNTNVDDEYLMLVNKYFKLDKNFVPKLKTLSSTYGSGKINAQAYDPFIKMCKAAKADNIKLKSVSAYRSYSTQKSIYSNYSKNGNADSFSARAGHSEHQTGYAIDINTASSSYHFENKKEYKWLIENSYKYGFILRYPNKKTFITGYKYEPWHFRYVGIEAATKIYEEQITFEEYLFKYGK